jgi:hypothetical protein
MKNMNIQLAETDFGKKVSNIALVLVAFSVVSLSILPAANAQRTPTSPGQGPTELPFKERKQLGSLNLQGSTDNTPTPRGQSNSLDKWFNAVLPILRNVGGAPLDILALQEAGVPSATVADVPFTIANQRNTGWGGNVGDAPAAEAFTWRPGSQGRGRDVPGRGNEGYYVYWMNTDPNGAGSSTRNIRVNLAIVTRTQADIVYTFYPPGASRAVLAVLIEGTWYLTAHARSGMQARGTGNDVPAILAAAQQVFGATPFILLGDWNNEPSTLDDSFNTRLNALGGNSTEYTFEADAPATHPNYAPTNAYDYFIANTTTLQGGARITRTEGTPTLLTDHRVRYWRYDPVTPR